MSLWRHQQTDDKVFKTYTVTSLPVLTFGILLKETTCISFSLFGLSIVQAAHLFITQHAAIRVPAYYRTCHQTWYLNQQHLNATRDDLMQPFFWAQFKPHIM